jgi:GT2 family glycosyltransferase
MDGCELAAGTTFVVIANWNGKEVLKKCLASVFMNTDYSECRVVVVDNASTDGSIDVLEKEFPIVKLIRNSKNLGFTKAVNKGIKYAITNDAKYVLLLNNDVEIPEKNWLISMLKVLESNNEIGIVGCKLLYPNGRIQHAGGTITTKGVSHLGNREEDKGQHDRVRCVDYVTGAALLIKTKTIRNIGLLDEGFSPLYFEDTDWCTRARFCGYKVMYTPVPALIHKTHYSVSNLRRSTTDFYLKKNWIRFFLLNFRFTDLIRRLLLEFMEIRQFFIGRSLTGRFPFVIRHNVMRKLLAKAEAWAPNIRNLRDIIAKRKQRFASGRSISLSRA